MAIKHRLGRLAVTQAAFRDQSLAAGAALLQVVHYDPFDQLVIAQALVEGLIAVSSDCHWPGYDLPLHRV